MIYLAETTLGKLRQAIDEDLTLRSANIRDPAKLIDYALLWLHEQEVIRLNKGMAVFRPAMTINLSDEKRGFLKADFVPLKDHYEEQVLQIHVMAEYAQRALKAMADALHLAMDYFSMPQGEFIKRWLPDRGKELGMQTTPESWRRIVDELNNPVQQRIVSDEREQTNVLVLAGPWIGQDPGLGTSYCLPWSGCGARIREGYWRSLTTVMRLLRFAAVWCH